MRDSGHHLGAPPPRRVIPEPVAIAVPAVLFGVVDFFVLQSSGRTVGSALGAALAMATFVAVGVWWIRRSLRRLRTSRSSDKPGLDAARGAGLEVARTTERTTDRVADRGVPDGPVPDGPVAGGGWANPTGRQRVFARVARLVRSPLADQGTNPLTGTRPGRKRGQR